MRIGSSAEREVELFNKHRRISSRPIASRSAIAVAVLSLALAGCSSEGSNTTTGPAEPAATTEATTTTTEPTTTTTEATTTTATKVTTLPASPVGAILGDTPENTYKADLATGPLPFDDSELPAQPGQVEVSWYTYNERYVAAFVGLETTEELCPGASLLTQNGFEFVSNAPTTGTCEGFPTLTTDPLVEARVCQEVLFYVTLIPSDGAGILFGTLEALAEPGIVVGLTSQSDASAGAPPLDLDGFCS